MERWTMHLFPGGETENCSAPDEQHMVGVCLIPVIRASDYDALQAELKEAVALLCLNACGYPCLASVDDFLSRYDSTHPK